VRGGKIGALSRQHARVGMVEPHARSWWTTLPGVLTGVAALLTALTGLLVVLLPLVLGRQDRPVPDPGGAGMRPALPVPGPPARRDGVAGGPEARPAEADPRRGATAAPAGAGGVVLQPGLPPPLRLGEAMEVGGATYVVVSFESTSHRSNFRDFSVTFRATAGEEEVRMHRDNLRILDQGRMHNPVEGPGTVMLRAGATRQFWVRFEIEEPVRLPILSFRDDWFAPRGEVRRALGGL
jgi:hypothetical protein